MDQEQKFLNPDDIFQTDDRPFKKVFYSEWNTLINHRIPDALTLHKLELSSMDEKGKKDNLEWMLKVIYKGSFKEDQKTHFFMPNHIELLKSRNPAMIAKMFGNIMEVLPEKKLNTMI
jgi:hypothetical protein